MTSEPTTNSENALSITNSSGEDLVILNSFDESSTGGNILFDNKLYFVKSTENHTIISDQEIWVIHLDGNLTSKGEKLPSRLYDFLFVKSSSLFPIAHSSIMKNDEDDDGPAYSPITITEKEKAQMLLARKFCMHLFASPTSKLCVEFIKALQVNIPDKKPESLNELNLKLDNLSAVNAFFQKTNSYKTLDFFAINTELSYLRNYVGAWINNKETSTFYFYTQDSLAKGLKMPTLLGTLTLTKLKISTQFFELKNVYKSTFTKEKTKESVSLEFNQGVFRSKEQGINIVLMPFFTKKSTWTKKSTDKVIMVAMAGNIEQENVLGSEIKIDTEKPVYEYQPGSLDAMLHPKTFAASYGLFMSIIGLLFAVHFMGSALISAYRFIKGRFGGKNPTAIESLDEKISKMSDRIQELVKRQGVKEINLQNIDAAADSIKAEEIALNHQEIIVNDIKSCKLMKANLKRVVELKGADRNIEDLAEQLHKTEYEAQKMFDERIENIEKQSGEISKQIKNLQELILKQQNELSHRMTEVELQQVREIGERFEDFREVREQIKENIEDLKEGEDLGEKELEVEDIFEDFRPIFEI